MAIIKANLDVANKAVKKYCHIDIPSFLINMHSVSVSLVQEIKDILLYYSTLSQEYTRQSLEIFIESEKMINLLDPLYVVDDTLARNGVKIDGQGIPLPPTLTFEKCGLWKENVC